MGSWGCLLNKGAEFPKKGFCTLPGQPAHSTATFHKSNFCHLIASGHRTCHPSRNNADLTHLAEAMSELEKKVRHEPTPLPAVGGKQLCVQ